MTDFAFPLVVTWALTNKSDEAKFLDELQEFGTIQIRAGNLNIDLADYDARTLHGTVVSEEIRNQIIRASKAIAMNNFVNLQSDPN